MVRAHTCVWLNSPEFTSTLDAGYKTVSRKNRGPDFRKVSFKQKGQTSKQLTHIKT